MKKFSILVLGILAAVSMAHASGTVILDSFYSEALGITRFMRIYFPEGYDTSGLYYPVVYFYHGGMSNHNSYSYIYALLDTLIGNGHIDPVIVVKPDASVGPYYGSVYTNSALYGNFEDYLVYDLIAYIDTTYRVISSRNARCVMGHSMGGQGALKIAFAHPDVFRAVADHSGLVDHDVLLQQYIPLILSENGGTPPYSYDPNAGVFTGVAFTLCGAFSPDTTDPPYYVDFILDSLGNIDGTVYDLWNPHDIPVLAAQLPPDSLAIYLDCGTSDEYHCYPMHTALVDSLTALGLTHEWHPYAGSHSSHMSTRIPIAFSFLDSVMNTGIKEGRRARPVGQVNIGATLFRGPIVLPAGGEYQVFDISGRKVDITRMSPGIYFVTHEGSAAQKVIKIE